MITDSAFAQLCAATYTGAPTWTGFCDPLHAHDQSVQAIVGEVDGISLIGFRGSRTPLEWLLDFLAVAVGDHSTTTHAVLGEVHLGFLLAADSLYDRVKGVAAKGKPLALYGHSLGAALAVMTGALLVADGIKVAQIVALAPPRCGFAPFVRVLGATPIHAYRYGNDPVTDVPPWMTQPRELITVGADRVEFLSCHHIENYVGAVTALDIAAA